MTVLIIFFIVDCLLIAFIMRPVKKTAKHIVSRKISNDKLMVFVSEFIGQGKDTVINLRGRSMRPYLEDGRDKALLGKVPDELKVGDVILAKIPGNRFALHRIVNIEGDEITMYGDGNFSSEHTTRQDVIAIAKGFYRKGRNRLEPVDTWHYRLYWKTWVKLRPIRRWLLLAWRTKHYPVATTKMIAKRLMGRRN